MSTKSTIRTLVNIPFISDDAKRAYLNTLRDEIFAKKPFNDFIHVISENVSRDVLYDTTTFPLVADHYDWMRITEALRDLLSFYDESVPVDTADIVMKAWRLLPGYLDEWQQFYNYCAERYTPLSFLHAIFTNGFIPIERQHLRTANSLGSKCFLSLDSGIIRLCIDIDELHKRNHLVSRYKSKLDAAIIISEESAVCKIDYNDLIKKITSNRGVRYYNISTDKFANAPTVKSMPNCDDTFKIVAQAQDTDLFNKLIIELHSEDLTVNSKQEMSSSSDEDKSPIISIKVSTGKRPQIPANIRYATWRKYCGNTLDSLCWSCHTMVTFENWHAGHVLAWSKGGPDSVDNLRPLCSTCNHHMSDKHMRDYIRDNKLQGKGAAEFLSTDISDKV